MCGTAFDVDVSENILKLLSNAKIQAFGFQQVDKSQISIVDFDQSYHTISYRQFWPFPGLQNEYEANVSSRCESD